MRISLSVPESCIQEILNYAGTLLSLPILQSRHLSRLYPYAPVEGSPTPVPPVSQSSCRSLGDLSFPARGQTLLVQRMSVDLHRPHPHVAGPEQAVVSALDLGHLPVVPVVFVVSHCESAGGTPPYQLSLGLVAASCRAVL